MKQKFISAHLEVAEVYAKLSSAVRLKVGCVIVKDDTIIGIGYNGTPSGSDNVCETLVHRIAEEPILKTKDEVIHAEINAISKVAKSTNSSDGATMFVTHAPCIECAKALFQSGIRNVYYRDTYRNDDGVKFLEKLGVDIQQINNQKTIGDSNETN
jgi:dCMP deaminase